MVFGGSAIVGSEDLPVTVHQVKSGEQLLLVHFFVSHDSKVGYDHADVKLTGRNGKYSPIANDTNPDAEYFWVSGGILGSKVESCPKGSHYWMFIVPRSEENLVFWYKEKSFALPEVRTPSTRAPLD